MDNNTDVYISYRTREDWKDVTPIKQCEHERVVCKINYSEKFVDVYDYIRAVMAKDERSDRALKLTEDALNLNPANYSVWYYRRNILEGLNADLSYELNFVAELINENPKNYQVWYHRQWIVTQLSKKRDDHQALINEEFVLIDALLMDENKNYHVWQYRSWLVNHFKNWENELTFSDKMLRSDCFNNSAWNHRYYVIKAVSGFTDNVIEQETGYVLNYIRKAPENESGWNYLIGLYKDRDISGHDSLRDFCTELCRSDSNANNSPYLHSFLLEFYLSKLRHCDKVAGAGADERSELLGASVGECKLLAERLDRIRANYWMYRMNSIVVEFGYEVPI